MGIEIDAFGEYYKANVMNFYSVVRSAAFELEPEKTKDLPMESDSVRETIQMVHVSTSVRSEATDSARRIT